eukprot:2241318-Rhodomonas_salina.2
MAESFALFRMRTGRAIRRSLPLVDEPRRHLGRGHGREVCKLQLHRLAGKRMLKIDHEPRLQDVDVHLGVAFAPDLSFAIPHGSLSIVIFRRRRRRMGRTADVHVFRSGALKRSCLEPRVAGIIYRLRFSGICRSQRIVSV